MTSSRFGSDSARVRRWDGPASPDETALRKRLAGEGLSAYPWSNGPGETYSPHTHAYAKVVFVVRGSISFGLPESGETFELAPGDRLDLPAGVVHDARVGSEGVDCLEAHR